MVGDPFYESQENHNLIGVANIFLECLFHNVKLDYHVPIISQQGEVRQIEREGERVKEAGRGEADRERGGESERVEERGRVRERG